MSPETILRFVTSKEVKSEQSPWGRRENLCMPGVTEADKLFMVRMNMPVGQSHPFHRHPEQEEIIYVISGKAEQWVDQTPHVLGPGDMAHIPANMVHGTYNIGDETLVFLAILSPASAKGAGLVDVVMDAPWSTLRPNG